MVITIFVCLVGLQTNAQEWGTAELRVRILLHPEKENVVELYYLIFIRMNKNCLLKQVNMLLNHKDILQVGKVTIAATEAATEAATTEVVVMEVVTAMDQLPVMVVSKKFMKVYFFRKKIIRKS